MRKKVADMQQAQWLGSQQQSGPRCHPNILLLQDATTLPVSRPLLIPLHHLR